MTTTLVTLTGDVTDAIGTDFDTRRTKAYVRHNTDKIVTDSGPFHLGGGTVNVNTDGTFELPNVVASTSLVTNLQATVYVDYADPATRQRATATFGPYDLSAATGTVDIRTLEAVQALDPSFASTFMTDAQALLDAQILISGIDDTDSAVAGLISDPLVGPLTNDALSASIDDEVGLTPGATADTRNLALNPLGTQFGSAHDGDVSLGGTPVLPNRFGNGALGFMGGYDNHRWGGTIAAILHAFHVVVRTTAGHPGIFGGSWHAIYAAYAAILGGFKSQVGADRGAVIGGRYSSAGFNAVTTLTVASTAGATSITVASVEGMAVGQDIYIDHGGTSDPSDPTNPGVDAAKIDSIVGLVVTLIGPYQHVGTTNADGDPTGAVGLAAAHPIGTRVYSTDGTATDAVALGDDSHAQGKGSLATSGGQAIGEGSQAHHDGIARAARSLVRGLGAASTAAATDGTANGAGALTYSPGQNAYANGIRAASGDRQYSDASASTTTPDATTKTLFLFSPPVSRVIHFRAVVVATDVTSGVGGGVGAAWEVSGLVRRGTSTAVGVIGSITVTPIAADAAASTWTVTTLVGSGTFNARVTAEAGKLVAWTSRVDWVEVG